MANLGLAGISSLRALNDWINVIDTNISNSTRVGYKETRLSMSENVHEVVGKTFDKLGSEIVVPGSSLIIGKTLILDYEQGQITPTGNISDFGINGRGYFVVQDDNGNKFATRDGQFNFDSDGILRNLDGLKVLSAGQDFIKVPVTEKFEVDRFGISLNNTTYGNRQLMMVNIPNAGKLYYSQYGLSSFELGNYIPIEFKNDFSKTMDGINPYLVNSTFQSKYYHDSYGGKIDVDTRTQTNALLSGHQFTDFISAFKFTINDANVLVNMAAGTAPFAGPAPLATDFSSIGFHFAQNNISDNANNSGFFAGLRKVGGNTFIDIRRNSGVGVTASVTSLPIPALVQGTEYELTLSMDENSANLYISEVATGVQISHISAVVSSVDNQNKYASIGTLGGDPGGIVSLTGLHINEINKKAVYDTTMVGGNAEKLEAFIQQGAVEQSTGSVSDSIPLLGNTQKVFAAVSKIISVSNTMTDDLNSLIR